MKMLSIIVAMVLIVATSCHQKPPVSIIKDTVPGDNVSWIMSFNGDSLLPDTVYIPDFQILDSLKDVIRSRDSALFEARFKLARVWYYDSLCLKNSRLDKYLKGWIRRTLEK